MAKVPSGQALGFLLVDKPKEMVSFFVVRTLRKIFQMKRIGYAGTLDPLATGLMIVAVGEATKLLYALEQMDKVYDVKIQLGATSETYDAEGPIHPFENLKIPQRAEIEKVIEEDFSGERMQIPPQYSAVKIQGKHAYTLARRGQEVQLPAKKVIFYDIQVRAFEYPFLDCSVHCSTGTYIRSFAHDLGQKLGCGGYVQDLRRTKIASHTIDDAVPLNDLNARNYRQFLRTPEDFLRDWQHCNLTIEEYTVLRNGGYLRNRWDLKPAPALAIFEGTTVGLLELCEGVASVKFAKKFNLG